MSCNAEFVSKTGKVQKWFSKGEVYSSAINASDGICLTNAFALVSAGRCEGATGSIESISLTEAAPSGQSPQMCDAAIIISREDLTVGGTLVPGAAFSMLGLLPAEILAVIEITSADYKSIDSEKVIAGINNIGQHFQCADDSMNLYAVAVARNTAVFPQFTELDLSINIVQD